ncbi:nucleotidyltransferase family protein [Deferrisoma sp.]
MVREYTEAERAQWRRAAEERAARRARAREARRREALEVARRLAEALRREFGATRVVLFGSAVEARFFHERSDVDLAAWGIAEDEYLRAVSRCLAEDPRFSVDLVRAEEAPPRLRETIEEEGVEL